jgi:peptide/nickel transport system permease protein
MVRFVLRRLLSALVVVIGVSLVTFVVARLVPSDPAALYAGPRQTAQRIEAARDKLGLDQPLPAQYARFAMELLRGDMGISLKTKRPIGQDILTYLPPTLELVFASVLISALIGIPLGAIAGANVNRWFDHAGRVIAIIGLAIPAFWLALILQLVFFGELRLLPLSGRVSSELDLFNPITKITGLHLIDTAIAGHWEGWADAARHLALPTLVLSVYPVCLLFRLTRTAMIEALAEQYIIAAQARGVPRFRLLFRHALRNALIPALNALGLVFAYSLTGAVLVETIFAWPGLGRYVTDAILASDFPVIIVVTLLVTVFYVAVNLITDLAQAWLDPRARLS